MDKALLKAYIRTVVEEEVKRLVPEMLAEAVAEVKKMNKLNESTPPAPAKKAPAVDRKRLAELMGIDYNREAGEIRATTTGMSPRTVMAKDSAGNTVEVSAEVVPQEVRNALNKDYSALMKAMKLS
jgi:hypothetical protein